jgi:hypothetical protein
VHTWSSPRVAEGNRPPRVAEGEVGVARRGEAGVAHRGEPTAVGGARRGELGAVVELAVGSRPTPVELTVGFGPLREDRIVVLLVTFLSFRVEIRARDRG